MSLNIQVFHLSNSYCYVCFFQGATSHHLGQNFSKMFEIDFEDPNNPVRLLLQNSVCFTLCICLFTHSVLS